MIWALQQNSIKHNRNVHLPLVEFLLCFEISSCIAYVNYSVVFKNLSPHLYILKFYYYYGIHVDSEICVKYTDINKYNE